MKRALSDTFRVMVVDEAQWLPPSALQYWRYLWDDRQTQISVIFVGGEGCVQRLRSDPALWSRIHTAQAFRTMDVEEVLRVIPLFHPVWAGATEDQIALADEKAAHGNFRLWALLTLKLLKAQQRHAKRAAASSDGPDTAIDPDLLSWVLKEIPQP